MTNFYPWPSIDNFHTVRRNSLTVMKNRFINMPIQYKGKMKLHGTNAGIAFIKGRVYPQSRSQYITVMNDNAGFAKWVFENQTYFENLKLDGYTVFGEWVGPNIMKGTACNLIDRKYWMVFGMIDHKDELVISEPSTIMKYFPSHKDIHIIPWHEFSFTLDWTDVNDCIEKSTQLTNLIEQVELCDPLIKEIFGINGLGEGIVYYPNSNSPFIFRNFAFKAKGLKHKVVKTKALISVDPEKITTVNEFVEMFLTENRLEQGVREVCRGELDFDKKFIGPFLGWVCKDVEKESKAELEENNLTWNDVSKNVQQTARIWFLKKTEEFDNRIAID